MLFLLLIPIIAVKLFVYAVVYAMVLRMNGVKEKLINRSIHMSFITAVVQFFLDFAGAMLIHPLAGLIASIIVMVYIYREKVSINIYAAIAIQCIICILGVFLSFATLLVFYGNEIKL